MFFAATFFLFSVTKPIWDSRGEHAELWELKLGFYVTTLTVTRFSKKSSRIFVIIVFECIFINFFSREARYRILQTVDVSNFVTIYAGMRFALISPFTSHRKCASFVSLICLDKRKSLKHLFISNTPFIAIIPIRNDALGDDANGSSEGDATKRKRRWRRSHYRPRWTRFNNAKIPSPRDSIQAI